MPAFLYGEDGWSGIRHGHVPDQKKNLETKTKPLRGEETLNGLDWEHTSGVA
jgi:hypothetical protein